MLVSNCYSSVQLCKRQVAHSLGSMPCH